MPTNDIFLVLVHTQLGQVGTKLTIDAPEQLVVTAKVRPYHKHLGQWVKIIALYHWTPDEQTEPTVFTVKVNTHIKLVDDMEITIFRGILYDLYGTFRANLYYQLEDGTRIGTENAATLKIHKNHPPADIQLSNNRVKKGSPQDTVIGTLSTVDEDRGELPPLYGLVDDADGRFAIRDDQLIIRRAWLVKQAGSYSIIVRSIDTMAQYLDKSFTVEVTD